jgi:hypothetical protein
MDEQRAKQTITAYAACTIVGGCDLCPLFKEELERTTQRGICQESIAPDRIREALEALCGRGTEKSIRF